MFLVKPGAGRNGQKVFLKLIEIAFVQGGNHIFVKCYSFRFHVALNTCVAAGLGATGMFETVSFGSRVMFFSFCYQSSYEVGFLVALHLFMVEVSK